MKISGIYKIINRVNGKYYIGSSRDIISFKGRWYHHKYLLRKNRHDNILLQRAWNKNGEKNFDFIIEKEVINTNDILLVEQQYLDKAKKEQNKCYNLNFKAEGSCMRDNIKNKLRLINTGCKNPAYDPTIYSFFNVKTKEIYKNTKYNFRKKYDIDKSNTGKLISEKMNSVSKWILFKNKKLYEIGKLRIASHNSK